ncbi:hypothetical protein R1flu_020410 [Riccia fluitans]|uniref:Pentatricopeptide repeat-containing protein-mitochondrial domain-containing protein n=1 Tax=Riccia fluitans TaxID=41844 RepID=A0ABD1ZML7_9MARC
MSGLATTAGLYLTPPAAFKISVDDGCSPTTSFSSSWGWTCSRHVSVLGRGKRAAAVPSFYPKAFLEKNSNSLPRDNFRSRNFRKSSGASSENVRQNGRNPKMGEHPSFLRRTWKSRTGRNVNKKYGQRMKSILETLDSEVDVERGLESLKVTLNSKEQSVILNEQKIWTRALAVFTWFEKQESYNPNIIHYNIMLKILGRAQQWKVVDEIWTKMQLENITPTNVTFSTLIDVNERAGRIKEALEWVEIMQSKGLQADTVTANTVINLYKGQGNIDAAEKIFKELRSAHTNLEDIHLKTVPRQTETNDRPEDLAAVRDVETYNVMIDMYGKAGRFADASNVFSEMMDAGVAPDTVTFNTIIKVCGLSGRRQEAEAMFLKMEESGIAPDLATFNTLIAIFCGEGNLQVAMDYFQSMKIKGIVPDEVTFNTLLSAFVSRNQVKEVESLLKEMQELSLTPGESVSVGLVILYLRLGLRVKASSIVENLGKENLLGSASYAAIIYAYGKQKLWYEAEKLFLGSREKWTVEVCNTMMKAYGLAGLHEKAVHVLKDLEESGLDPDETTFNNLLQSLVATVPPDMEYIQQVLGRMRTTDYKLQRSTSNLLIGFYGKLGLVKEAEETFRQIEADGVGLDGGSYSALVNAYAESGLTGKAQQTTRDMEEAGFPVNEVVLTTLMKAYGRAGKLEEAQRILQDIEQKQGRPDVFAANLLMDLYARDGNIKDAENIYKQLQAKASVNEVTLTTMLEMYKRARLLKQALGVATRMLSMSELKDVASYNCILGLYASLGRATEAMEVFKLLESRNVSPDIRTYTMMASVLKRIDSVQEAIDLLSKVGHSQSLQSLTTLGSLYARAGLFEETFEVCGKLRRTGFTLDVAAYNALIFAYGSAGRFDESLRMFMEMQSKGLEPDTVTYTTVITVYGKAGLLEGVTRMFKRMKQAGCEPNMATYNAVIDIYRNAGKTELAAMVSQEMKFTEYLRQQQSSSHYTDLTYQGEV